jgi:RHS repeat-associated protein
VHVIEHHHVTHQQKSEPPAHLVQDLYDALSRRTQLTRPNNVATNYTYDPLSRLQSVLHQLSGSTIDGATYTVDNAGNRTSKTDKLANVTSNYAYDPIYQLTGVTQGGPSTESYTYDLVSNRLTSTAGSYAYNNSNELTASPTATFTYDSNGNTLTKTDSTGTTTYSWDFEDRLTSVTLPGTGGTVAFKYDPLRRRIQKATSSLTTSYLYDGSNLLEEIDASGNLLARYTQTQKKDEPLAMLRSGTTNFYQADGLGSVTSLSTATGTLANTYAYDSLGNLTGSTGSVMNPLRYTARDVDPETSLYFLRARYYDPGLGRFLSEDPIRFAGGINSYDYVRNNPANLVDPSGLAPTPTCGVNCDTVLPNGKTIGDIVRQYRAVLLDVLNAQIKADQAAPSDPIAALTGTLGAIASINGPIDFKNIFKHQAKASFLGDAGNFTYYAIGSGFLPTTELDAGASLYAILTHRSLMSPSARAVRNAALAANGCE